MAYDEALVERVRKAVGPRPDVTEKRMFGGLAFLLDGKMFVGISGSELMVRVGPDRHDEALGKRHVRPMDFTGRPMKGYVFVEPPGCRTAAMVAPWVKWSAGVVAQLPQAKRRPKRPIRIARTSTS